MWCLSDGSQSVSLCLPLSRTPHLTHTAAQQTQHRMNERRTAKDFHFSLFTFHFSLFTSWWWKKPVHRHRMYDSTHPSKDAVDNQSLLFATAIPACSIVLYSSRLTANGEGDLVVMLSYPRNVVAMLFVCIVYFGFLCTALIYKILYWCKHDGTNPFGYYSELRAFFRVCFAVDDKIATALWEKMPPLP